MLGVLLVCLGSGTWELPPGALRERLSALAPEQAPAELEAELGAPGTAPGLESGALEDARVWRVWHRSLATLLQGDDARAHARLALVALDQGRARDAWQHLEACSGDAGLLAALAPRFLPGVARGTPLAKGGSARALPDGCVLRPALPPPIGDERAPDEERRARRRVRLAGIEIGRARVGLQVTVEAEGVQVELTHESGEAVHVSIVIPRSEDYAVGAEYVDWFKQDTLGAPLAVELKPGEEPHVLFARFEPRDPRWPTRLPEALPAAIEQHGLVLVAPEAAERGLWTEIASALSFPEIKLHCRLRGAAEASPGGIEVDLGGAAERSEKLAWLVSSIERFATRKTTPR